MNLLGKYINTDEVGDDGTKSQNGHCDAFHPKSATLDGTIFLHIQVATMTCVQVWALLCRQSTFIEAFKGLIFFHSFQIPFWSANGRGLTRPLTTSKMRNKHPCALLLAKKLRPLSFLMSRSSTFVRLAWMLDSFLSLKKWSCCHFSPKIYL